ncbi:MAG TPA: gamma subclass chorismate mutase AroQ [Xanthobacteraceae bacterium]|nr:gamma subclass chorismate mutase AroQ [Xanthobacteraceae bacterium]
MTKPAPIARVDAGVLNPAVSRRVLLAYGGALGLARFAAAAPLAGTDPLVSLIELMRQRLDLMVEVARSKWNTGSAVEDLAREQSLADDVARLAPSYGINPQLAATFFRAQIEAAKLVESALIARWALAHAGAFVDAADQRAVLRPKIDRLTAELLPALAAVAPALKREDAERILEAGRLSDEVMALAMTRALQPLLELCGVKAGG